MSAATRSITARRLLYAASLLCLLSTLALARPRPADHTITVAPDGSFSPQRLTVRDGDVVEWVFAEPTDSVIPLRSTRSGALVPRPYHANDPTDFTGPMPFNPSGIFALGPVSNRTHGIPAVKRETWESEHIVGVFLRPKWSDVHLGPGQFDWSELDREMDRAVRHGKLFSLCFKAGKHGTPDWIFDTDRDGSPRRNGGGVERLFFRDGGNNLAPGRCGSPMHLGSPMDPAFKRHYFDLLRAVAEHLRSRSDWYRSLAYIKPSGANLFTHENRLPKSATPGCFQNPEAWARAGYTPTGLYRFYAEQLDLLADELPGKGMSYMLIHAGFPKVNDQGDYLMDNGQSSGGPLPEGVEQTETILDLGQQLHGPRFVVQHNGLRSYKRPNRWVRREGRQGQATGFQTVNLSKLSTLPVLEQTLQQAWDHSDAFFIEIYEEILLQVEQSPSGVLDPTASGRTLREWGRTFHQRRLAWRPDLPPAFSRTLRHRFRYTAGRGHQVLYYTHGSKRIVGGSPNVAAIVVVP